MENTNGKPETKKCPYCGEEILHVAIKCKHCGERFDKQDEMSLINEGTNKATKKNKSMFRRWKKDYSWKAFWLSGFLYIFKGMYIKGIIILIALIAAMAIFGFPAIIVMAYCGIKFKPDYEKSLTETGIAKKKKRDSIVKKVGITFGCIIVVIIAVLVYQKIHISEKEFFIAVDKADFEIVRKYIEKGNDINAIEHADTYAARKKRTPLLISASSNISGPYQTKVSRYLIEKGAEVNITDSEGKTPLYWAVHWTRDDMIKLLLENGADPNIGDEKPLLRISGHGLRETDYDIEIVKLLIKYQADINHQTEKGRTALLEASDSGFFKIASLLINAGANVKVKDNDGNTPLIEAADEGSNEIVELLIKAGADINAKNNDGYTPLINTAAVGSLKTVELLINVGAGVNSKDKEGMTALMWTFNPNMPETSDLESLVEFLKRSKNDITDKNKIISLLLKNGAKINAKNNKGATSLLMAIGWSYQLWLKINRRGTDKLRQVYPGAFAKIIENLLKKGANPNVKNEVGSSALMIAVIWENIDVINLLIKHGADANAKNNKGESVLDVARVLGTPQIVNIIRNAKNKRSKYRQYL